MEPKAGELFIDGDKLNWNDVSNETRREYVYADGSRYVVNNPLHLNVKQKPEGDSHRLICAGGKGVYVRPGWIAIEWWVQEGTKIVSF